MNPLTTSVSCLVAENQQLDSIFYRGKELKYLMNHMMNLNKSKMNMIKIMTHIITRQTTAIVVMSLTMITISIYLS